jgi:hypothetical protein
MCRLSTAGVLTVCLFGSHWNSALLASAARDAGDEAGDEAATFAVGEPSSDVGSPAGLGMPPRVDREIARPVWSADRDPFTGGSWFAFKNETRADRPAAPDLSGIHRRASPASPSIFNANAAAQVYRGRPYRTRRDHTGAIAAMVVGAIATITGAAILVYANRPECRRHESATGCGYGTKVVGGAVLSGGAVGLTIGALTWR